MAKESHSKIQMFLEKLSQLEQFTKAEQKQKIGEMNEMVNEMDRKEFESVFTKELFNEMDEMIKEEKLSMRNAILLLKHIGYLHTSRRMFIYGFEETSLNKRFEKMIFYENKKKEGKNEKLFVDLCECCFSLSFFFTYDLTLICVPCLLKVSLKKDEDEEIQKEVEVALLALSNIFLSEGPKELYLNEIKEIIQYHQEHHNLTHLAYQSSWNFLIFRLVNDESLDEVIVNELHFGRESTKELEVLTRNVDWKKKEEEMSIEEANEVLLITGWMKTMKFYFNSCKLWNEEYVKLIGSVVQIYRTAKDNYEEIRNWCVFSLRNAAGNGFVPVDGLLKSGAIDVVLEDLRQPTLIDGITHHSLTFFVHISRRLKLKTYNEMDEAKRKDLKRKIFEELEEEGYEDIITSYHGTFCFLSRKHYLFLTLDVSVYFVNV